MKWKIKIGRYAGIDVYMHVTFFLLLLWVAVSHWLQGKGASGTAAGILFVLAIFACVTLHEYGHALAARRFGIATRDIVLLPIGGVARLERMPREPLQEIRVALAGPAVNLVLAGALFLWMLFSETLAPVSELTVVSGPLLERLMVVNLFLVGFNLIPAFPMDGGRVLRAVLAMRGDYARATQQAAYVGQGFALLFVLAGLFLGYPILLFIALFVWIGAAQEAGMAQMGSALSGIPVRRAMVIDFKVLDERDTLDKAIAFTLAGNQTDFPVTSDGRPVGLLTQSDLLTALRSRGEGQAVADAMKTGFTIVDADEMLEIALGKLDECACHTMIVLDRGRLAGLLTMENVGEFVRIQAAAGVGKSFRDLPN